MALRSSVISVVRSILAVVFGYIVIAAGTILTFNIIVGQISVASSPSQLLAGTVGAVLSGLVGGMVAGLVAPRAPILHALAIWILLAIDTASVIANGSGPVWFDLAGSGVLAVSAVIGGGLIGWRKVPAPELQTFV
jgi:hypothetical protein